MRKILVLLAATVSKGAIAQKTPVSIDLACDVSGTAMHGTVGTVTSRDQNGNNQYGTVLGQVPVALKDQVRVWVNAGEGRMRVPPSIVPGMHGGDDGWFKLKKLEISESQISGKVAINAFNNGTFRIDRYTGAISYSGKAGTFAGVCRRHEPEKMERQF